MNLPTRLQRLAAFDEERAAKLAISKGICGYASVARFVRGDECAHARLQPLLQALIKTVKLVEDEMDCCCGADDGFNGPVHICLKCEALARLEALVEESE